MSRVKKTTVTISEETYRDLVDVRQSMKIERGIDKIIDERVTFDIVISELVKIYRVAKEDMKNGGK